MCMCYAHVYRTLWVMYSNFCIVKNSEIREVKSGNHQSIVSSKSLSCLHQNISLTTGSTQTNAWNEVLGYIVIK